MSGCRHETVGLDLGGHVQENTKRRNSFFSQCLKALLASDSSSESVASASTLSLLATTAELSKDYRHH